MSYYSISRENEQEIVIPLGAALPLLASISAALLMFWFAITQIYPSLESSISIQQQPVVMDINSQSIEVLSSGKSLISEENEQELITKKESITNARACAVSSKFPQKITRWCELITSYSSKKNIDPNFIASVMLQESGGNPLAYSASGAVGLMQIMPRDGIAAGFTCANGPCFSNRPSIKQLEDPEFNIDFGTRMLASLIKRHGNYREALYAYGPMNVGFSYADKVLSIYRNYSD